MRSRSRVAVVVALAGVFALAFGGSAFAQFDDMPGGDLVSAEEQDAREDPSGGADGAAVDVGNSDPECTDADEPLPFDVPAIDGCQTADGRTILDLPGMKVVGPADPDEPAPAPQPEPAPAPKAPAKRLPTTGVNAGDFLAMGMAALGGGGVLLRRLRLSFTS